MIRIYSGYDTLDKKYRDTGNISAYFQLHIFIKDFDDTDKKIIGLIDKAEVIADGIVRTPFGVASKEKLSKGSKTALIINYWKKNNINNRAINVISCGGNALSIIYELVNDTTIALVQEPMFMGDADTAHNIIYNDGEFEGDFEAYADFILERSFEAED